MKKVYSFVSILILNMILVFSMFAAEVASGNTPQSTILSAMGNLTPLVMIVLIFYFLIFRPQQKKIKEHRSLLSSVKKGDAVITSSGIHGIVSRVEEGVISIEISTGVIIKIQKDAISTIKTT